MKVLSTIALLSLVGCATQPLTDAEKNVRILRKSDPDRNCKEIGKVQAPGLGSISDQGREDDLKRATAKAGGDTVTIDKIDENRTHYGTAFKCL